MNEVMELSVESSNVFRPAIIKIYDPKEILSTDGSLPFHTGAGISKLQLEKVKGAIEANERNDRLTCRGRAMLQSGSDMMIEFYIYKDKDGDRFIGYEGVD